MQHPKAAGVRFKGNRDPHPIDRATDHTRIVSALLPSVVSPTVPDSTTGRLVGTGAAVPRSTPNFVTPGTGRGAISGNRTGARPSRAVSDRKTEGGRWHQWNEDQASPLDTCGLNQSGIGPYNFLAQFVVAADRRGLTTMRVEEKAFLSAAVAALPRIAEIISDYAPDEQAGALEVAERRFIEAAQDYGCIEIAAQSRVSILMKRLRRQVERRSANEEQLRALLRSITKSD
jgi:hypothetical protein